ncbi:MAG TPA: methylated-DNA--[protein]-cysteine S-methyltransferase [Longimicrobiaceae bacterium]|nr:methylated-DNA--[protein]-cysteine S-methyltransferase [Longimicrobiaceae bacterium]
MSSSTAILQPATGVSRLLLSSPVGPLMAEYTEAGLRALHFWPDGAHPPAGTRVEPAREDALGWRIAEQLREYFTGARRDFDLPLAAEGTAFQRRVWAALARIPAGETRSYGQVAAELGSPGSSRAVGQANRRNPLPIVVPCHRVLAADRSLGGYAGSWGADGDSAAIKRWLLRHEGAPGW